MNSDTLDDEEVFLNRNNSSSFYNNVSVGKVNLKHFESAVSKEIYMKSTLFLFVLNGSVEIEVNFKYYKIKAGESLLLSFGHILKINATTSDFEALSLYIGTEYSEKMYSTDMLYKRVKYGVKMYKNPHLILNAHDMALLVKRVRFVAEVVGEENHRYHLELILNTLRIFFLDLSNIIEQQMETDKMETPSREELYFQQFLDLLVHHYKSEHLVDFYASQIHITPHYLTVIVKKLSGQTVSDFIFQLLYSDARQMLKQPKWSIQEISELLHFSDQSAFGKFFKRKNGKSPSEFRKTINS